MKFVSMEKGQALVTLLFFTIIGLVVTTAAATILYVNMTAGSTFEQAAIMHAAAESGAENALLRLLRNPSYVGEPALTIGDATVQITVANNTILATASAHSIQRTIQVQTVYNSDNSLHVSSWKEVY